MSAPAPAARAGCSLARLGMACSLGVDLDSIWQGLRQGDVSRLSPRDDLLRGDERLFGAVREALPPIPAALARHDCRNNQLALVAYEAIADGVASALQRFGAERVGVVVGSSTAGVAEGEAAVREKVASGRIPERFHPVQLEYGGLAEFVRDVSGARGPAYSLSTACSTGAKALVSARSLLDLGLCDAVVAGAVDSLCGLTANGFGALQALSSGISNPMSATRDGLTLGEAAALFLMLRDPSGIQLLGAGESSDAHHISAPDPDGAGAEAAMRAALADARCAPGDIDYLNLHGTGTPHNDSMESRAVARVFPDGVPTSSTKPLVGHTLGASGALEAGFCWLILDRARDGGLDLPRHRYDGAPDPELPALDLVGPDARVEAGPAPRLMTNSFGFGGSNCTLVLGGAVG
ncbi:MAG: beta-ketoacyl-ACP synthase [Myxococcota bacterium]